MSKRLLKRLQEINSKASKAEVQAFVTAGIPLDVRQKVTHPLNLASRTAIEEQLDTAYADVAIAIIESWRVAD